MTDPWTDAAQTLAPLLERFELRFSVGGQVAVRVLAPAGPVAPRHAEPPDPDAPWSVRASCGDAVGWLLASAPPADEAAARDALQRAVDRHSSLVLQRIAAQRGEMAADLLETVTHRLRTDISALQLIAEGALAAPFDDDERPHVQADVAGVGAEAQRRLSATRDVIASLHPRAERAPEPLIAVLEGAGMRTSVAAVRGEVPMALVSGWSTCARLLAADQRLAGAAVVVRPDSDGWSLVAGSTAGEPVPWSERALGELAHAGAIVVAAGGSAEAWRAEGRLSVRLIVPAAPSAAPTRPT